MATYKVLQDIEAEDTLIGPLTLRQCIYGAIAAVNGYLSFVAYSQNASWLIAFFLPFIGLGVFFAFPWRKEQSTEVWALARIRFSLKPRKRIWDQSGVKDLVTVTVPKQLIDPRARHMSEREVRGRLKALADTIDSRGWAVKNAPLEMFMQPGMAGLVSGATLSSDRLVEPTSLPRDVPTIDATHATDMFDLANNPLAQQFDTKMTASSSARRQELINQINNPGAAAVQSPTVPQNWYMPQASAPVSTPTPVITAAPVATPAVPTALPAAPISASSTAEEEAQLLRQLKHKQELAHQPMASQYGNLRTIQPLSADLSGTAPAQPAPASTVAPAAPAIAVTPPPNPAILELANNNDLNVATIAREAKIRNPDGTDEVVVSLH